MGESTINEPSMEEVESIQVTNAALSGAKAPKEDTIEHGTTTKKKELDEQIHEDGTSTIHANLDEGDIKTTDDPENQTERVQTTKETEYETTEGGVKKLVKSSVKETKEFSHKVHRTVYNDSPDSTSLAASEFSEFPRPRPKFPTQTNTEYKQKLTRTPVISTVRSNSPRPVFIERTIDTSRMTDARTKTMPHSGQASFKSEKDMSRSIDGGVYEVIHDSSSNTQVLRNAKNISDVLAEELKTSRKQYEYMLTKTVHMENTIRELHEKLRDYRNKNKQLNREVTERESLVDKLHEAHSQLKRLQRYLEKVEDERSMLIKDYEILRQSHNRKEQQLHGYTTERAELLRRLDILEYEKQQLEYQLMDSSRRERSTKYHSGSVSSRKTHKYKKTMQHISSSSLHFNESRATNSPYGELPISLQADLEHLSQSTPTVSATKPPEGEDIEGKNKQPGWSVSMTETVNTAEAHTEVGDDQTLMDTPTVAETQASAAGEADTLTVEAQSKEAGNSSHIEEDKNVSPTHQSRTEGKSGDIANQHIQSSDNSPQRSHPQQRHRNKSGNYSSERTGHHLSATDSQEEEIEVPYGRVPPRIVESYGSPRHTLPRSYYIKRRSIRQPPEYYTARSMEFRGDFYNRSSRYKRPSSAYGFIGSRYAPREYDVYPSPLPPRSTTSFGKFATIERIRSPDREYSRVHRSPVGKSHVFTPITPLSPDPFRFEPMRSSRADLNQLESQLEQMKREKRRLEKQFNATETSTSLSENLRRREELLNKITRLAGEIRHVQLQVSRMY